VSFGDVVTMLPFDNRIDVLTLTGAQVKQMFENSVAPLRRIKTSSYGGFLQVSGAKLIVDMARKPNDRVVSLKVLTRDHNSYPHFVPVDPVLMYTVAMTNYVADGGDKHSFTDVIKRYKTNLTDTFMIRDFVKERSPLYPVEDGRIMMLYGDDTSALESCALIQASFSSSTNLNPGLLILPLSLIMFLASRL